MTLLTVSTNTGFVPDESPDNRSKQVLLGWRLGVSPTAKPCKTWLFTKECHNVDMLKQQGVSDNMAIMTPVRKKTQGIRKLSRQ